MVDSEEKIQSNCFLWFWNTYPEYRGLLFHVPNGGKRNSREANKLKAMGVVPGIPDLLFLWKGITYYIEMKNATGELSPDQKRIKKLFVDNGAIVFVCRELKSFKGIVLGIMNRF